MVGTLTRERVAVRRVAIPGVRSSALTARASVRVKRAAARVEELFRRRLRYGDDGKRHDITSCAFS